MTHLENRFRETLDLLITEKKQNHPYMDYGIGLELARRIHDAAITEAAGFVSNPAILTLKNPEPKR